MSAIKDIEQAALALPIEQRVKLAESLLESLPLGAEDWPEAEELAEVERREQQIERGESRPIPEKEFWKRVNQNRER